MDQSLPQIVFSLVDNLPEEYVNLIVRLLEQEAGLNWARLNGILKPAVPQVGAQDRIVDFINEWKGLIQPPSCHEMALVIQSTCYALDKQKNKQKIELTWTGPTTQTINLRRTDQALLELINSAEKNILIVSFVVYKARPILSALEKAARQGVEIIIILESPDISEGKFAFSAITALGESLRKKANVFIWPYTKRSPTLEGRVGVLHAKVGVADEKILYISSANLTDNAMNMNMEMGVLIHGGDLPGQVGQHFNELITNGTLVEIA